MSVLIAWICSGSWQRSKVVSMSFSCLLNKKTHPLPLKWGPKLSWILTRHAVIAIPKGAKCRGNNCRNRRVKLFWRFKATNTCVMFSPFQMACVWMAFCYHFLLIFFFFDPSTLMIFLWHDVMKSELTLHFTNVQLPWANINFVYDGFARAQVSWGALPLPLSPPLEFPGYL